MPDFTLILVALFVSFTGAVGGVAGGVILFTVMLDFFPAKDVIPLHGLIQIANNISRTVFGMHHVEWRIVFQYVVGAVLGALLGAQFLSGIRWDQAPLWMSIFILTATWMPTLPRVPEPPVKFTLLGIFQTALSLFIGVTGPINIPFLLRENLPRDRVVITHAVQMTAMHVMKVITFGFLGFTLSPYLTLLGGILLAVTLGSYLGTIVRQYVPESIFRIALKWLITVLCLRLLFKALF